MANKKNKANVASPSLAWQVMSDEWTKIYTLLAGTEAMRDAGEDYLPMHAEESQGNYDDRLSSNVLFNMTSIVLNSWVGKPFAKTIQFSDDFDKTIFTADMVDDIDLEGNALYVFCRDWFKNGIAGALAHVLVDMPRVNLIGRTAADDLEQHVRPYFVFVAPQNLLFAHSFRENGREMYDEIRIMESLTQVVDWEEVQIPQVRRLVRIPIFDNFDPINGTVLDSARVSTGFLGFKIKVELWRQTDSPKSTQEAWQIVEQLIMDIPEIPLVTFYADRTGFMTGKSPILDLADLNIRHWQSSSDQINVLTVARFPMLGASGMSGEEENGTKTVVGPKQILYCSDPNGKYYYVEHTGAAIMAGRMDLQDLVDQMRVYGANFTKKRTSRETATAANIDSAESTSPLQDVTSRFNDALAVAMYYVALWRGKKSMTGRAVVSTEFTSSDPAELMSLEGARTRGDLARPQYLKELKRRGILDDEFDLDANEIALRYEEEQAVAVDAKAAQLKADLAAKVAAAQPKPQDQSQMDQRMIDQQNKLKNPQ